jgi:hypothetical protein
LKTYDYLDVRKLLEAAGLRYQLRVSYGVHEGTDPQEIESDMNALCLIMGESNTTILGQLSDDAVAEELANSDYVLSFFEKGVRANNTTVHAALDAGCRVITNHDEFTTTPMKLSTLDIGTLKEWPELNKTLMAKFTWDKLIQEMQRICAQSPSPIGS